MKQIIDAALPMIGYGLITALFIISMAVIHQAHSREVVCTYEFPQIELELER